MGLLYFPFIENFDDVLLQLSICMLADIGLIDRSITDLCRLSNFYNTSLL